MTLIDERWIKQEVENKHKECCASKRILCECCGLASAHVDVEGVPLCCYCVAAEELEEQRRQSKRHTQKMPPDTSVGARQAQTHRGSGTPSKLTE